MPEWVIILNLFFEEGDSRGSTLNARKELPQGTTYEQCLSELDMAMLLAVRQVKGVVSMTGECKSEKR